MAFKKYNEGKIELFIPKEETYEAKIFFNPAAKETRDLSVAALQVFQKIYGKKIIVLDALSATGVRGLRYAKEVSGIKKITLNDNNPLAYKLIKKNIKGCKKCKAENKDATILMRENIYDAIDIDPFGPPVYFLDAAGRSIYHKGFLAVTATDLTALCGAFPDACFRKYGIKSKKVPYYAEMGMRILISSIMRALAVHEKAFVPVLSISSQHYLRTFGIITHGKLDNILKQFGTYERIGPIYLGPIHDKTFVKQVIDECEKREFETKKLKIIYDEIDEPFYHDIHTFSLKEVPKFDEIIERLKKNGFKASRTHFCMTGIKTDANQKELLKII